MGGTTFEQRGSGKTAREAFDKAVSQAKHDHGHGGYSGTLAEKHSFVEIKVPADAEPRKFARQLVEDGDPRVDDKWGPAGCVKLADGDWLFFGWASS
jgi:hypothetical protein